MKVAIGSLNPIKIKGTKAAYREIFRKGKIELIAIRAESGVSPQPLSLEETMKGALNRAINALNAVKDAFHGVGIEAGWFKIMSYLWMDIQVAIIVTRKNNFSIGMSSSFLIPPYVIRRVLNEGIEMEEAMVEITGITNIGEKMGAIGFLSRGKISREDLTKQAVLMALIPLIEDNKDLYEGYLDLDKVRRYLK